MTTTAPRGVRADRSPAAKIPGPRGNALLGIMLDGMRDRLGLMTGMAEEFGDVVRFKLGPKVLYFLNHPDHAKHVLADNPANYHKGMGLIHAKKVLGDGLLTSEGDLWKRQRRTINPAFHRERLSRFAGGVVEEAAVLMRRWRRLTANGPVGPIDVVTEMTDMTVGVLGRTLLDADLSAYESIAHAFEVVQDQAMFEMMTLNTVPHAVPLPRHFRFRAARRELERIVLDIVGKRQQTGVAGDDVLSRLLADLTEETDAKVRRRRLHDELVTILLAGHETTASTLSWAWYELSRQPEIAGRMRAEAREVFGDGLPSYEDLHRLTYTTMVIQETMRLHPAVWILPRRSLEADHVGGYEIPAGSDVMICPYTLHRHPDFWDEPDRFDPERFQPERAAARHRYAYIPFGGGPRFCIGSNLGMMEAVFVAAMVAREFRLELQPGREVVGDPLLILRVKDGLPMTIHHD
ncbi:MAG: enediyne biosynthesis protein [Micromonosporaceae bacterium]|nr:enediyne biosynthesis protein [Micromonosporaceae bacterium]